MIPTSSCAALAPGARESTAAPTAVSSPSPLSGRPVPARRAGLTRFARWHTLPGPSRDRLADRESPAITAAGGPSASCVRPPVSGQILRSMPPWDCYPRSSSTSSCLSPFARAWLGNAGKRGAPMTSLRTRGPHQPLYATYHQLRSIDPVHRMRLVDAWATPDRYAAAVYLARLLRQTDARCRRHSICFPTPIPRRSATPYARLSVGWRGVGLRCRLRGRNPIR